MKRAPLRELSGLVQAFRHTMYPPFVHGGELDGSTLPVFVYHRITAQVFRDHCLHLVKNGYRSLDADGAVDWLEKKSPVLRPVLLTFDDGTEDLFTDVYPVLRETGVTVVAFIAPLWIGTPGYLNWEQVREMHGSGRVDFQSHGHSHGAVAVSPRITGFLAER
ncbi:polysaccharide deacetylase family protein, partial [bacterium]|nr:polysaccharide deacetylase family protein [candidate division CSSED10-310 bacterium]